MAVTFVSAGTKATATTGTLTASMPASITTGDILIAVVQTSGQNISLSTANGFALLGSLISSLIAGPAAGANSMFVFWKKATASNSAPIFAATTNHSICQVYAFRGLGSTYVPVITPTDMLSQSPPNFTIINLPTGIPGLVAVLVANAVDSTTVPVTSIVGSNADSSAAVQGGNTNSGSGGGVALGVLAYSTNLHDLDQAAVAIGSGSDFIVAGLQLPNPSVPLYVLTNSISSIASTTATSGGNIGGDGTEPITERGICWSTSANPTIADSKATATGTTGSFSANLTGLTAGVTYHVRAYATNSLGTGYGNDVSFTTTGGVVLIERRTLSALGTRIGSRSGGR